MAKNDIDFDAPVQVNDSQDAMRQYMENYNRNEVRIAGTVRDVFFSTPREKMKKVVIDGIETKVPKVDEDGNVEYYDSKAYVTIAFDGGEMQVTLSKSLSESLIIGRRYLFEGVKGLEYGNIQDKFHSLTQL